MQESYNHPQDQSSESQAQLNLFINKDGELEYNCDWDQDENGLSGVAAIFYGIMFGDLSTQILQEIKEQCVSNNMEADYLTIIETISRYSLSQRGDEEDEVAVPPDQSYNI